MRFRYHVLYYGIVIVLLLVWLAGSVRGQACPPAGCANCGPEGCGVSITWTYLPVIRKD